jgi:two-component system chemotaxis sensor kinase CheA
MMDRSMVEQIGDPLVHMVRNAVDHGVESPEERQRTDKPPVGTLSVAAYHEGGRVIIEIADDGRGLRRDLILRKAIEKGVVHGTGESLSDAEVHALIFAPGFSTAAQVTEISGRGVGMDVVKRNVEALRGTVQVTSTPGHGTRFRLMLPLTLAVIDGMLVRCGAETYLVPSLAVTEALRPRRDAYFTRGGEAEFLVVRGDLIPMVRLAELFEVRGARLEPWEALAVIVESGGRRLALLVDDVLSQHQLVIKPLGPGVRYADRFTGAAVLSNGNVGLIVNVDRLGDAPRHRKGPDAKGPEEIAA